MRRVPRLTSAPESAPTLAPQDCSTKRHFIMVGKAPLACETCRRLKRKCTRDIPSCLLCIRLRKDCSYPTSPPALGANEAVGDLQQMPVESSASSPFPSSFFMDRDFFTSLSQDKVPSAHQFPTLGMVQTDFNFNHGETRRAYFSTVHHWLPFISQKRLGHIDSDPCATLLHLSMQLNLLQLPKPPSASSIYSVVRSSCAVAENNGVVSLRLVQTLVLLAIFEFSHAIYPCAFLTIGRAARLGLLMGLHAKVKGQPLLKPAETFSLNEEMRRTWWAIFVLDRLVNIESPEIPLAVPEPALSELLPINDHDWDQGNIVANAAVYTSSFSSSTIVGAFARTCQAAQMLGKVIQHKHAKNSAGYDSHFLEEAYGLHQALMLLQASIQEHTDGEEPPSAAQTVALSICITSRLLLYGLYGCNTSFAPEPHQPTAMETELQTISLAGIKELAVDTAPRVARDEHQCPFVAICFYYAASECVWFIKEDHELSMYAALKDLMLGLSQVGEEWQIGAEYISLLDQAGASRLIQQNARP